MNTWRKPAEVELLSGGNPLEAAGAWVLAGGLQPASSATGTSPAADGKVSMTDGPYADARAQMGGFWIIDVADHAAVLEWGRRAARACEGPVEVRPLQGAWR